ncbi:hypothetical protein OBBRIDRAFT_885581 [Obba rivulosa]|uniref:Uncharacterized protein n=1 Tax=Obba rivulosa TaxID=1052685 RepID=A0A8E2J2L2_9APHY|nr:hypothetical protein OBBRIDRAFT_885581 [Obba rivulosa]
METSIATTPATSDATSIPEPLDPAAMEHALVTSECAGATSTPEGLDFEVPKDTLIDIEGPTTDIGMIPNVPLSLASGVPSALAPSATQTVPLSWRPKGRGVTYTGSSREIASPRPPNPTATSTQVTDTPAGIQPPTPANPPQNQN